MERPGLSILPQLHEYMFLFAVKLIQKYFESLKMDSFLQRTVKHISNANTIQCELVQICKDLRHTVTNQ